MVLIQSVGFRTCCICLWIMLHAPSMWAVVHAQQCVQAIPAGQQPHHIPSHSSLEKGAVWGALTCWQDVHAMALCQGQHVRASGNEGLLVGQADVLSSLNGSAGGLQPGTADDACRRAKEERKSRQEEAAPQAQGLAAALKTMSDLADPIHM